MNTTEELARYVRDTDYQDLPKEAVTKAKTLILDSLGCALGGCKTEIATSILGAIADSHGGEATLIGGDRKYPCRDAAFANATLINALDFDDDNWVGHPSATILPAAMAVAERVGASGRDLLTSFVLAFEVVTRIGWAIWPSKARYDKVWGVGTHQVFGAVSAAAKILALNEFESLNAFGIAGAVAPLPSAMKWGFGNRPLTWVKDSVAYATVAGLNGALLAKQGFLGCRDILDGETGFWIMAGSDRCDFGRMVRGLRSEYLIMKDSIKPWPACRFIHATLDAVSEIVKQHSLKPEEIEEVRVRSIWDLAQFFVDYQPFAIVDAQFSVPYTIAMVIMGEKAGANWFDKSSLRSAKLLALAKRVVVETDQKADDLYHSDVPKITSNVTITTKNGNEFGASIEFAKGEPENPLSPDEVEEKFMRLATVTVDHHRAKDIFDIVDDLDRLKKITDLTELLRK